MLGLVCGMFALDSLGKVLQAIARVEGQIGQQSNIKKLLGQLIGY